MRNVTAGLFIILDGVTEAPSLWQETFDEDMGAELMSAMVRTDTILLGRLKRLRKFISYTAMEGTHARSCV